MDNQLRFPSVKIVSGCEDTDRGVAYHVAGVKTFLIAIL